MKNLLLLSALLLCSEGTETRHQFDHTATVQNALTQVLETVTRDSGGRNKFEAVELSATEVDAFRRQYLETIRDERGPKHVFDDIVKPLKERFGLQTEDTEYSFAIQSKQNGADNGKFVDDGNGIVTVKTNNGLSIGRMESNDVSTPQLFTEVSRIQAVVLAVGSHLVLLDTWCFADTRVYRRSADDQNNNEPMQQMVSSPTQRRLLVFGRDETVILEMAGAVRVVINPQCCDICLNNPRSKRMHCGHALCNDCLVDWAQFNGCPRCRQPVNADDAETTIAVRSFRRRAGNAP